MARRRQTDSGGGQRPAASPVSLPEPGAPLTPNELLSLAGLLAGTLLTYALTFTFGWVYDDPPQIPQNPNLEWSRLGYLFTHQLWASLSGTEGRFYRPLLSLWFLINKTLFGLNPHGFHVTSVLAHVGATALAFFVAGRILKENSAALFAAAIFGLHPLQAESASWISSVNDSLAAVFCFASFLIYRRARAAERGMAGWWALSGFLFLLALLTKEVSVVLPGIILIDLWANPGNESGPGVSGRRPFAAAIFTYAPVGVAWLGLRSWALNGVAGTTSLVPMSTSLMSAPKIFLFNLYRTALPIGLSPQYDFRPVENGGEFLLYFAILIALAGLGVAAARRNPVLWVAFAWLVLTMLPTLNLGWMNQHDFIHDRYMYMSMLGVALLAGSAYAWLKKCWPELSLLRPLAAALVVVLGFASAIQSQFWANDVLLFSRAVNRAPENEWAQLNYGSALSARGKYGEAAPHFVRSYELNPTWRAADFAGFSFQQTGDLAEAERWFNTALQQDPGLANAFFGLAQIRLQQQRPQDAIPYLQKALELQADADGYHYEMGSALEQLFRRSEAIVEYQTELRLHPYQKGARKALDRLQSADAAK